jgi:hypothetical protein
MPLRINGATSGYVQLAAPNAAGSTALVLPTDSVQPGLVLVASGSVTSGSTLSIDGCFTAAYDNYRIALTSNVSTTLRWRAASADNSSANYYDQYILGNASAASAGRGSGQTSHATSSGTGWLVMDVFGPALASTTYSVANVTQGGTTLVVVGYAYFHNVASAFDGFSLLGTSMTANVRVYGYRNSITT